MKNKRIPVSNHKRAFGTIDKKALIILLIAYIAFLFGFCVVFRKSQEAMPRPGLFRSYRAAWYGSHLFPFAQNIIFNILLYTPIGFLLSGIMDKERRAEKAVVPRKSLLRVNRIRILESPVLVLVLSVFWGFVISTIIERMQLQFHRGTDETDDIINNTFGTLLGASWIIMYNHRTLRDKLFWITIWFFAICFILMSRLVWLCYLR